MKMEVALNYKFKRRSTNYFEWLHEVVKSENYFQVDSMIIVSKRKTEERAA